MEAAVDFTDIAKDQLDFYKEWIHIGTLFFFVFG
jgi:hypothetical protein